MATETSWEPFGIPADQYREPGRPSGPRVLNLRLTGRGGEKDRAARWLRNAMLALGALAIAAAAVSYAAQFAMVEAYKNGRIVAGLEAAIPDVSAVVFASLGIALALHGKRAVRARLLNVGAVATSIAMNYLAAAPGWRGVAIWVMPPVAYALASDTAIGVIRAYVLARQRELHEDLADDDATPLVVLGGFLLWWLRLALAPASTAAGFRHWVVEECPVAPGRKALACDAGQSPRSRRRSGPASSPGRRRWDALTPAYQARLSGAGITRETYERGASLDAARGHQSGGAS